MMPETETAFTMNGEVRDLKERFRELSRSELAPYQRAMEETDDVPAEVREIVRDSGLHGLQVPEDYGGMGLGMFPACVVTEELAWLSQALVRYAGGDGLGIGLMGTDLQKQKYLPGIASGEYITAFALTERGAGSDALSIRCAATPETGGYRLNGEKIMVTCGDIAGLVLVFAVTDPDAGPAGVTALLVEKGFNGYEVLRVEPKMGLRGVHTASLGFKDVMVPEENVLGGAGRGFPVAMRLLDLGRIRYNGATSVGNAQRLLELSVFQARDREQFGRPVGNFEAVGFMLARMAVDVHAARLMVYDVALKADSMKQVTLESAMTKLHATEMLDRVADMAVQIYGGRGYLQDDEVERFYRDARLGRIWDGTSEIQQLIISRMLTG